MSTLNRQEVEPWLRLGIYVVSLIATVGYVTRGAVDQQAATEAMVGRMRDDMAKFGAKVDNLSDQLTKLAISNEHLSVEMLDQAKQQEESRRHIEKLEDRRR